jgi:hypothetical protein
VTRQLNLDGTYRHPACKHRARTRETSLQRARYHEIETCRCGATRTRTLELSGAYALTPWTPDPL